MKKIKIIIGVLSILIGIVALIESYDVFRLAYAFGQNGFHIYVGFIVGLVFIGLGILSMVMTDEENNKKYAETAAALCSIAFFFCFRGPQLFTDLYFFAGWAVICFIFACVVYYKKEKSNEDVDKQPVSHLTSQKECPYCHAVVDESSTFCGSCGKKISMNCPHCGALIKEGSVFCTECGNRIDEVPQTISFEQPKPKCPHCGAYINESEVFCTECGKKIEDAPTIITETSANAESAETTVENEDSVRTVVETPQVEEETKDLNYSYVEEEPKTWRDYKLPIFGGIFIVLFLGACWWYYSSSSIRAAKEKVIADSLEMVRQDSIKRVEAKMEEEKEETDKEQHIAACKAFLEKFYAKGQDDNYIRQNITNNALQILKDEYDYDCEDGDCLATWIFYYEAGSDFGTFEKRTIEVVDENTYIVGNYYNNDEGDKYLYSVRIGIVKEGNFYKIDKIEKEYVGLDTENNEVNNDTKGKWLTLHRDFDRSIRFKKVRVKSQGRDEWAYVCVKFSTTPNNTDSQDHYEINLYSSKIMDNTTELSGDDIMFSSCKSVGDGWYEYVFSRYLYYSYAQTNAKCEYVKVYIEN